MKKIMIGMVLALSVVMVGCGRASLPSKTATGQSAEQVREDIEKISNILKDTTNTIQEVVDSEAVQNVLEKGKDIATSEKTKDMVDKLYENTKKGIEHLEDTQINNAIQNEDINYDELVYTDYYAVVGRAVIELEAPKAGEVVYGGLDKLGRPKYVIGNLTFDLVDRERKEERQSITVDPAGFVNNQKVVIKEKNGEQYKGYFYNRSHLLADSLGGNADLENLVTGTRTQNVGIKNQGGMAYTEEKARTFFKNQTDVSMLYQVIPIYLGDEVVPRYVRVDILTSDGSIDEEVIVKNSATGFAIDYKTGEWKVLQ